MNIGQVAEQSGISAKMIRHYESIGLIPRAQKGPSGYRRYDGNDVRRLAFVRRARDAGLATADIKRMLGLWQNSQRSSREVKALVQKHVEEIEARIASLAAIREALAHLMQHCKGNDRPECPIIEAFSDAGPHESKDRASARPGALRRLRTRHA